MVKTESTWPKVVYLKDANSINAIKKPKSSNWIESNGIVMLMDSQTIASLIKIRFVHYPQFDRTKTILSFEILTFFQSTHKKTAQSAKTKSICVELSHNMCYIRGVNISNALKPYFLLSTIEEMTVCLLVWWRCTPYNTMYARSLYIIEKKSVKLQVK